MSTSLYAYVPEHLDVERLLKPHKPRVAEGVLLLGSFVLERVATNAHCRDDVGRVSLKAEYLRNLVGRHHLADVRKTAEQIGYIGWDRSYEAGARSQKYWIREPYAGDWLVKRAIKNSAIRRNVETWSQRREANMWERIRRDETPVASDVCEHLWRYLQQIRIDDNIELGEGCHPTYQISIDQIRNGLFRFTVDDYGRIHTNVTNLPRMLRKHLSFNGERLVNVDISESQPLFVGLALKEAMEQTEAMGKKRMSEETTLTMDSSMMDSIMMDKNDPKLAIELREYIAMCEQKSFYHFVASRRGVNRDEAKALVLQAFFDKPQHRSKTVKILEERFPAIMRGMQGMKRGDYRRFAHFAQRIESRFMFGRVVRRVMTVRPDLPIATIHDSILTTADDGLFIKREMLREFTQLGLSPDVKVEPCQAAEGYNATNGASGRHGEALNDDD